MDFGKGPKKNVIFLSLTTTGVGGGGQPKPHPY